MAAGIGSCSINGQDTEDSFAPCDQVDKPGVINSGTYLLSPKLFAGADWPEVFSFERDFLPWAMDRVHVRLFETESWFLDIGVPEDFDRAQTELPVEFGSLIP